MGILEREIALYRALCPHLGDLSIVTNGGAEELAYQDRLGNIHILHNRWGLPPNAYSLLAPLLHWRALREASVYKTNQLDGAWTAVIAGKIHHKPVIVRAGYMWAKNFRGGGNRGLKVPAIDRLEKFSIEAADTLVLTTETMEQHVVDRYGIRPEKITVVPNYVDTKRFQHMPDIKPIKGQVCYVGRLHPVKNLRALIKAVSQMPSASLILIGEGEQRRELETLASHCKADVQFAGVLEHDQIPLQINRSEVFVLPSLFEGHPKALIEAMACSAAVVGTDVEGIRDVIRHEETGLLCPPTVEGIAAALKRLLADDTLRRRLGRAARARVEQMYSLSRVTEMELAVLQRIQNEWSHR
jgi:glycosyltransferase involved in cell wall biosynthesis